MSAAREAMATYTFCFVGRRRCCGRPFMASIDDGDGVSESVRDVLRNGDRVEYMTLIEFNALPFAVRCDHEATKKERA